jgi:hypothetical protein
MFEKEKENVKTCFVSCVTVIMNHLNFSPNSFEAVISKMASMYSIADSILSSLIEEEA